MLRCPSQLPQNQPVNSNEDKVKSAIEIARKVKWAPFSFEQRAEIIATAVIPHALYGCEITALPTRLPSKLRSAVLAGI